MNILIEGSVHKRGYAQNAREMSRDVCHSRVWVDRHLGQVQGRFGFSRTLNVFGNVMTLVLHNILARVLIGPIDLVLSHGDANASIESGQTEPKCITCNVVQCGQIWELTTFTSLTFFSHVN